MIYINNSTNWVEIPKTYPQNVAKYGLRFINQTTHNLISLICEDSSQVDTLYKFYLGNVIDKFEIGQYDYMVMSPDWQETYTSGVLQFGEYKAQVVGYSPTINIIQYNPYIAPAPHPKKEIDIVENGTYDVENFEIANVNVPSDKKPEEVGSVEYVKNGEYVLNPNEGNVFSSVNVKVNTPEPKEEQTKSVNIDKNGDSIVTPDSGNVLTSVSISVNVPSDKKPEETFNKTYTDNGTYDIEPTTDSVFSSGTVVVNVPKQKPEETFNKTYTDNGTFNINPTSGNVFSGGVVNVNIPKQKEEQEKTVNIVENGTTSITPDSGKVLSKVDVNVNVPATPTQSKEVSITENKTETITPDSGYNLSAVKVIVNVPNPTLEELSVTENGVYTPTEYGYSKVTVNVPTSPSSDFKLPNGTKFGNSTFSSITLGDTTSEITDFTYLLGLLYGNFLTEVGEMNTSKGTIFNRMFYQNVKLTTINGTLDMTNATSAREMFYRCELLENYPTFIFGDKLTNTAGMFMQNYKLTSMPIPLSKLANVKITENMYTLSPITDSLYNVDLPKATNIANMFGGTKVKNLSGVDAPLATTSNYMFFNCTGITQMPSLNLPNVVSAEGMFEGCTNLGTEQLAGQTFNLDSLRNANTMFKGCNMNNVNSFPILKLESAVSMFEGIESNINYDGFLQTYDTATDINFSSIYKDSNVNTSNLYINEPNIPQTLNLTSAFENTPLMNDRFELYADNTNESKYIRINANRAYYNCTQLDTLRMGVFSCSSSRDNITDFYSGITDANSMLYNCTALTSIYNGSTDVHNNLMYMGYCTDVTDMFYNCTNLNINRINVLKDVGKGFTSSQTFDLSYLDCEFGFVTSEIKYFVDVFYDMHQNTNGIMSSDVYFNPVLQQYIENTTVPEYENKTVKTILEERGWNIQYQSH